MRPLIILLLLSLISVRAIENSRRNKLEISVVAAMQPSAPLQVSGISMPPKRKTYGALVHNSSNKKVTGYEVWWTAAAPPGCAHVQNAKAFHFSRTVRSELAPEGTTAEQASEVNISEFEDLAEKLHTDFLQVQVGLVKASFEGGASWKENIQDEDSGVFMPSLLQADSEKCQK